MKRPEEIPHIEVGILFSEDIRFRLNTVYRSEKQTWQPGDYHIRREGCQYISTGPDGMQEIVLPLNLYPENEEHSDFDLTEVVIGIQFHWERKETQKFKGQLRIIDEGAHLTAVNILPLEEYLISVISSEMSATSSLEFLKAHAVISRSWLLAQKNKARSTEPGYPSCQHTSGSYIRWYDREDHAHFDVCADDHCQRYQGITKAYTPAVRQAVETTRGEVLMYEGNICDARFSKCCGGITERFENTWEPVVHPYLDKISDSPGQLSSGDLTREEDARKWILSSPLAFCNTSDPDILSQILNDYDQETRHFFRWREEYTVTELSELVRNKLGIDFGTITDIQAVERGVSGRLIRVRICGSRKSLIIGKELTIRKAFSPSHLYSSAFVVTREDDKFIFRGAGWGHGVGLCQIGAAVMGAQGYSYRRILQHYFKDSELVKNY